MGAPFSFGFIALTFRARAMVMRATSKEGPAHMARKAEQTPPQPAKTAETVVIKKPELLDAIVARTNLKKRDVKPAVEAALAVIADALHEGAELNLPPLGKLRVVKTKPLDDGAAVLTLKLRLPKHASAEAANLPISKSTGD